MFGLTKRGYYQRIKRIEKCSERNEKVLEMVLKTRKKHTRSGTRKLMKYLQPELEQACIKIGRDALHKLLRHNGLLVKKTKRFYITTDSKHFFYKSPNLLKDLEITHSEQVFVCDITYLQSDDGHAYLALVTDMYSKKIMGFAVDDNMRVELVKAALKMAKKNMVFKHDSVIHHSDRGIQYCCPDYSNCAENMNFKLSTTQKYDPYENAVAERTNETLKYEYGLNKKALSLKVLKKTVKQAVDIYNNERIHWSLGLKTPNEIHQSYNSIPYKSYSKRNVLSLHPSGEKEVGSAGEQPASDNPTDWNGQGGVKSPLNNFAIPSNYGLKNSSKNMLKNDQLKVKKSKNYAI